MDAQKTVKGPQWLEENEIIALLLSHATTKREYFTSRANAFVNKYGSDFGTFKKRVEESKDESFPQWDDLIAWEAVDAASQEWKARYEELQACFKS